MTLASGILQRLGGESRERWCSRSHDQEFLEGQAPGQCGIPENVHERDREHIWLHGTGEVGNVSIEWNLLLGGGGLGNCKRDAENGIGA